MSVLERQMTLFVLFIFYEFLLRELRQVGRGFLGSKIERKSIPVDSPGGQEIIRKMGAERKGRIINPHLSFHPGVPRDRGTIRIKQRWKSKGWGRD
ncbi:hypothetical protein NPIL_434831 [Nephila pilipes]|uniref:Uncharacterized protein n=1 Tax=Nephila pilipes TaxID=299642 RepID=A0A8X6MAS4_NEPPI|nr:hypothetical protein NPIL_434831 [Nephila pilipes]